MTTKSQGIILFLVNENSFNDKNFVFNMTIKF